MNEIGTSIGGAIGMLAGGSVLVFLIATILKNYVFKKQKKESKNILSATTAAIVSTLLFLIINNSFTFIYLVSGFIVFFIMETTDSKKRDKKHLPLDVTKKKNANKSKCRKCGHVQDYKFKNCTKCSEEMD